MAGVQFFEREDHRIRRQPNLRQCQQDPAAHPNDRGRAALIVDGVALAQQTRQRAGITVPREGVHKDGELILGHGRINGFALATLEQALVTPRYLVIRRFAVCFTLVEDALRMRPTRFFSSSSPATVARRQTARSP